MQPDDDFDRLLELAVRPHTKWLAKTFVTGSVAVVVFDPSEVGRRLAQRLGWDGTAPVFQMSDATRKVAAAAAVTSGEEKLAEWLEGDRLGRVLVLTGSHILRVNQSQSGKSVHAA